MTNSDRYKFKLNNTDFGKNTNNHTKYGKHQDIKTANISVKTKSTKCTF